MSARQAASGQAPQRGGKNKAAPARPPSSPSRSAASPTGAVPLNPVAWRALIEMDNKQSEGQSSTNQDDDPTETLCSVLEGEDALFAMAVLLRQRLQEAPSLSRFVREDCLEELEASLVQLLSKAFDAPEVCPRIALTPDVLGEGTDGLALALMDFMSGPLPLGEDLLVSAVARLQHGGDSRVENFLSSLRHQVMKEEQSDNSSSIAGVREERQDDGSVLKIAALSPELLSALDKNQDALQKNEEEAAEEVHRRYSKRSVQSAMTVSPADLGMDISSLNELHLDDNTVTDMQRSWLNLRAVLGSEEVAADTLYTVLVEALSGHQVKADFTTPKTVHGLRILESMSKLMSCLQDPAALRVQMETLGFSHMQMHIDTDSVVAFKDSFLNLLDQELGDSFSDEACAGWTSLLMHVGGAILFVKNHYSERIKILLDSWDAANDHGGNAKRIHSQSEDDSSDNSDTISIDEPVKAGVGKRFGNALKQTHQANGNGAHHTSNGKRQRRTRKQTDDEVFAQSVPTTFDEMFEVSALVMGLKADGWLKEMLQCFGAIVTNAANAARLQEECDVLALRIAKQTQIAEVNLEEFKSCMLASLRSLLPKDWSSKHEEAWGWLWGTVERMLRRSLERPHPHQRAVARLFNSLDEHQKDALRQSLHPAFFTIEEAGQRFFKQSNTRLNYIAARILELTEDLYKDPVEMVRRLSALGLRHVGYGAPAHLFAPFVSAGVTAVKAVTTDAEAVQAFRWSLGLIAKILVRTLKEGSTIVMTAINSNNTKALKKALSSAPRGVRARSLLVVQVGTESISPLKWAIQSGALEGARAIIVDLLTIRADRERYYYGAEELFVRHSDLILMLSTGAPGLLPTLLEGLIWRARHTNRGMRRVNYYVKYLLVEVDGSLSLALSWLTRSGDLKIISHAVICLISDLLWKGVVRRLFIFSKVWPVVSLLLFVLSQTILPRWRDEGMEIERRLAWSIFAARLLSYAVNLPRLIWRHITRWWKERDKMIKVLGGYLRIPEYICDKYNASSLVLLVLLVIMACLEPTWRCLVGEDGWPADECEASRTTLDHYRFFSMAAMVFHWLVLIDLSIFSTKLASFVIVCGNILSEVLRFLIALGFLILTFASGISVLTTEYPEFQDVPRCIVSLFALTVSIHEVDYRDYMQEPVLLCAILLFVVLAAILLLNLLIAQLNCSYEYVYQDAVGFARLGRANLVIETLSSCPRERWDGFIEALRLDRPLEFDEGDVGLPGGIQVKEPASLHPVVEDRIHRFGGECSADNPWPEDDQEEEDKYELLQGHAQKILRRLGRFKGQQQRRRQSTVSLGSFGSSLGSSCSD